MGAGLGGFVDGIVFHQILQWHNMLSAQLTPNNLINAKVNMFWDGVFHAGAWIMTITGLAVLWHAGGRRDVSWSGKAFLGSLFSGWGLFNVVEGIIDHQLLGLHHVYEYTDNKLPFDMAFLALGALLLAAGWTIIKKAMKDENPFREI